MPLGLTTTVGKNVIGALKIRNDYGAFYILLLVKLLFLVFLALKKSDFLANKTAQT